MPGPIQDKDRIFDAYEDVRNDSTPTTWILLTYEGSQIVLSQSGEEYSELLNQLNDEERMFAYVRFNMGDEMSKRAKFALITWVGASVSAMKKAKLSTDKAFVKDVIKNFAVEILAEEKSDVSEETVKSALQKAGGANYGTGVRS